MDSHDLIDSMPDEDTCRATLREWVRLAGLAADYPLSEADVLRVLREGGQLEATPAVLARCETMGWFSPPESGEWSAREVTALAGVLHSMRFWKPSPSFHDLERGPQGVAFSEAVQRGTVREITDSLTSNGVDLRRALLLMAHAETRSQRELMFWSVAALLHVRGVHL